MWFCDQIKKWLIGSNFTRALNNTWIEGLFAILIDSRGIIDLPRDHERIAVISRLPDFLQSLDYRFFIEGIRLSFQERQLVLGRANNSGLKLSAYARAALLGADYVAKHDPVRRKLLQDLSRELGHQGNNLNQIAKQLNRGFVTQDDAYALLNDLGGSLVAAHNAVRFAMTEGKVKP